MTDPQDSTEKDEDAKKKAEPMEWADYLANHAPAHNKPIQVLNMKHQGTLQFPELTLHCKVCDNFMFFENTDRYSTDVTSNWSHRFISYRCKHCEEVTKEYAVMVCSPSRTSNDGEVIKLGEYPNFRPYVPSSVFTFFEDDEKLFLQARKSENLGLGIGAYAYYRQVVEKFKDKLIDEILKVLRKEGATADLIKRFEDAKKQIQFTKAIEEIESVMPKSLYIENQNPLTLLHVALSKHLHTKDDEECLNRAKQIRIVLVELTKRMSQLLHNNSELQDAVKGLLELQRADLTNASK